MDPGLFATRTGASLKVRILRARGTGHWVRAPHRTAAVAEGSYVEGKKPTATGPFEGDENGNVQEGPFVNGKRQHGDVDFLF